jgi:ABC-2 type transport system ATP-binding protein
MFGLLGPNGAGKSTLMRTIATLQEPDAGSISLDGIDVLAEGRGAPLLGYLPQEFGVYPKMSAEAMLDHFAVLKGIADGSGAARSSTRCCSSQPLGVRKQARRLLGRHAAALRHRAGAASATRS